MVAPLAHLSSERKQLCMSDVPPRRAPSLHFLLHNTSCSSSIFVSRVFASIVSFNFHQPVLSTKDAAPIRHRSITVRRCVETLELLLFRSAGCMSDSDVM